MCAYCEGPMTLSLLELGTLEKAYRYIKIENGKLIFRSTDRKGKVSDVATRAKFCIECGRDLTKD